MASHHHHCHCHNSPPQPPPPPTTTCCCGGGSHSNSSSFCSYSSCSPHHHSSPPPPPTDPLLQSIASQLLRRQNPQPRNHHKHHRNPQSQLHFQQQEQHQQTQFIISSLLQRIHALESSPHRFSSSSHDHACFSLRDLAARIIQSHFRAYLVRRSRTLRQLQDLALIKSTFVSLKSSLPRDTHFDLQAVARETMDLLLQLDSIQGGDPMIRDGKRAISRDLDRFLEFIEGVSVKRRGLSSKAMKNMGFAQNSNKARALREQREMVEKLRIRVEKIHGFGRVSENDEVNVELEGFQHVSDDDEEDEPKVPVNGIKNGRSQTGGGILAKRHRVQPRVKKNVSFADNGHTHELISARITGIDSDHDDSSGSVDGYGDLVENLETDIGRIESRIKSLSNGIEGHEEAGLVNEENSQTSDEERSHTSLDNDDPNTASNRGRTGSLLISAPLPLKMESRDDSASRKFVKVSRV